MDIKSFLHQKQERKARNIWIISTGVIIALFIICVIYLWKDNSVPHLENFIGEKVSVSGMLISDNNYPTNTHKIGFGKEFFGLKGSSINLNNFVDSNAIVDGNITEITSEFPVMSVSRLKIPNYKLIVSDNKYFYTDDLISFDFSNDTDVYSKKVNGQIVLYYQDSPLLKVDTFVCSNVTDAQNCEKMKSFYIKNLNETFDSVLGYTFYKEKENSRITFNDDNIGYIFLVENDNVLLNISHLINIVDSDFLIKNKKDFLLENCSNDEIKIESISKLSKKIIDNDLIKLYITGSDLSGETVSCKLNINIFNDREVINNSIDIDS